MFTEVISFWDHITNPDHNDLLIKLDTSGFTCYPPTDNPTCEFDEEKFMAFVEKVD